MVVATLVLSTTYLHCVPLNAKENLDVNLLDTLDKKKPNSLRMLFAKIPQDLPSEDNRIRELVADLPNSPEYTLGSTNQIGKILYSKKHKAEEEFNDRATLHLPLFRQPYSDYKILVVSAPPDIRMMSKNGSDPMVLYVVFPEDSDNYTMELSQMPTIYFVSSRPRSSKVSSEPIIIVDNNRTVTGIKSTEVARFVRFRRSKLPRTFRELLY
ncbi:hypothetical protein JYU34_000462 [Plutella xylostella]|uniref:Uncharacterized protein n=1 Tax=Plutella xylostella TaxID=51655 RepID=A0ABQ7R7R7_PLUXY|nr:hypothetical protein JYU34_000462 [Plutella xylostella]